MARETGELIDKVFKAVDAANQFDLQRLKVVAELANAPLVDDWTKAEFAKFREQHLSLLFMHTPTSRLPVVEPSRDKPKRREAAGYPASFPLSFSHQDVADLREVAAAMVGAFVDGERVSVDVAAKDLAEGSLVVSVIRQRSGAPTAAIRGPLIKAWELNIAFLLTSDLGSQLRRCGDHKCRHYFVRTRKRDYCSKDRGCGFFCRNRGCANRLNQEKWRLLHLGKVERSRRVKQRNGGK